MKKEIETKEQVEAKANKKAEELTKTHGVKVSPIIFKAKPTDEEFVVGFLKEPPRFVKLRMMDKGLTAPITAASEVMETCLIKESSDARIYSELPENDVFYMGATMVVYSMVEVAINQLKKN